MSMTKDFDTLKRKVYLAYHQDGILDLAAGSVVLGFSLDMLTGNIAFLIFGWLAMLLYALMKQRITIPRFGYVRFEPEQKTLAKGLISMGIGVLVLFLFFALNFVVERNPTSPEMDLWLQRYHMVPLSGMLFGFPALVGALLLGLRRFYLYAVLSVGLPAAGGLADVETFLPILVFGFIVLAIGIGLLAGFLQKYPLNGEAGGNASR